MLVTSESKKSLDFLIHFNFATTKSWKIDKIWVTDSRYLWFIWLIVFLFCHSALKYWHSFWCFVVNLLTPEFIFVLGESLIVLIPWVKAWYLHLPASSLNWDHIHYRVTQLRFFWWNDFLNDFNLLDGFRPVRLLMVYSYFIMIIDQEM